MLKDKFIKEDMTIEEAVKINPALIEVFSDLGIDFCCGGKRIIKDALLESKLDLDRSLDLFNSKLKDKSFKNIDLEEAIKLPRKDLIDYLVRVHHRREENLINEVDELLNKILYVHYLSHGNELSKIYSNFLVLKGELAYHFAKEEKEVFPKMLKMEDEKIKELEDEHEKAGEILHILEALTNNFTSPQDACRSYDLAFKKLKELVDDIHIHIFLENSILFMEK